MPSASATWRVAISRSGLHARVDACMGGGDNLVELFHAVEREGAHAIVFIGFADRFFGLDRMHEAQCRVRRIFAHQLDLGQAGHVKMRNAALPQERDQLRRGVGLDRIKRLTRKLLDKETGSTLGGMRTNERDRLDRSKGGS